MVYWVMETFPSVTILIGKLNFLGDLEFQYMMLMLGINMTSLQKSCL